jgi:hypothetical protein
MSTTSLFSTFAIFLYLLSNGCVSVQIVPPKPAAAKNVKYVAPPAPFVAFTSDEIDAGWKNSKKGSSISFKSICGESMDLPLEGIQQQMLYGIDSIKILKSVTMTYNEREALNSLVEGKVDGVDTKLELMILKKNRCTYMISYVALAKSFESDNKTFQTFLKNFEAP